MCRHPAVVTMYFKNKFGSNVDDDKCIVIMELAPHGDLESLCEKYSRSGKHFKENTIRRWMVQLIEALMYIHSIGCMHRDIKP